MTEHGKTKINLLFFKTTKLYVPMGGHRFEVQNSTCATAVAIKRTLIEMFQFGK